MSPAEVTSAIVFSILLVAVSGQRRGSNRFLNNYERDPYLMTESEIEEAARFPSPNGPGHHAFKVTQMGGVTEVKFGPHNQNRGRGQRPKPPPSSNGNSDGSGGPGRGKQRLRNKPVMIKMTTTETPNYPVNFPVKQNYPERKGVYQKKPSHQIKHNFAEPPDDYPTKSSIPASFPQFISSSPQPFVKKRPAKVMIKKIPLSAGRVPIKYMDNSEPAKPEKSPGDSSEPPKKFIPPETFHQMRKKVRNQTQTGSLTEGAQSGRLNLTKSYERKRKRPQEIKSLPPLTRKPDENSPPSKSVMVKPFKVTTTMLSKQPSSDAEIIEVSPLPDNAFKKPKNNHFELTEVVPVKPNDETSDERPNYPTILFHKGPRKIKTTSVPIESEESNYPKSPTFEDFGFRNAGNVLTTDEKVILNHVMNPKPTSPPMNYKRQRAEPKPRKKPAKLMEESEAVPAQPTQPTLSQDQYHIEVTTRRPRKRPTKSTVAPEAPAYPGTTHVAASIPAATYPAATNPPLIVNWDVPNSPPHGKTFNWNDYATAGDAWSSGPVIPQYPEHPPPLVYPSIPTLRFPTTPAPTLSSGYEFDFSAGIERQPGYVSYHVQTPRYPSHEQYPNEEHYNLKYPEPPPTHQWNLVSQPSNRGHYATSHQSMVLGHSGKKSRTIHDFVIHHRY